MAKDKTSFVLYCDIIHTVEKLSDAQAGLLFKHILKYVNDQNPETGDSLIDIAFEPIKQSLKRNLKRYEKRCAKNAENINKRWHKQDNTNELERIPNDTNVYDRIRTNTKHTDSDSDSDKELRRSINKSTPIMMKGVTDEKRPADDDPDKPVPKKASHAIPAPKPDDPDYEIQKELHLMALKMDTAGSSNGNYFEGAVLKIPIKTWNLWVGSLGLLPGQLAQACAILDMEMAAKTKPIRNPLSYASKVLLQKSHEGSLHTWMRRCKPAKLDVSKYLNKEAK
jgi:hypothetical protein